MLEVMGKPCHVQTLHREPSACDTIEAARPWSLYGQQQLRLLAGASPAPPCQALCSFGLGMGDPSLEAFGSGLAFKIHEKNS